MTNSAAYLLLLSFSADVVRQTQATELPARGRVEEIPIACACMPGRCRVRGAAQHHLVDHELAIVLAKRAWSCAKSRIWRIGAACPLPDDPECVIDQTHPRRHLPLGLRRQILGGPARERVGFVIAHM